MTVPQLEGYCGGGCIYIGFSEITEENDVTTKHQDDQIVNLFKIPLDGSDNSNAVYQQVKQMEAGR